MSFKARSKNTASPLLPRREPSRIAESYAALFFTAWSKIVGLDICQSRNRKIVDVVLECAIVQQVTSYIVEPEALAEIP